MLEPRPGIQNSLKTHGQSWTQPRQLVFSALQGQEPQTMRQLVAACPRIDRSSVYRTIALFERLGIVQRLKIGWKYKLELSGDFQHHHHHLTCLKCAKTTPFGGDSVIERRLENLAADQNFVMRDHQLEIQGLCEACAQ